MQGFEINLSGHPKCDSGWLGTIASAVKSSKFLTKFSLNCAGCPKIKAGGVATMVGAFAGKATVQSVVLNFGGI